ncbi:uncharacterized protein LOC124944888 [Impatiens glandulifera]|uniref:uncharacterized protein LOC124944888 n=1 Tax=Impatiens glandulifera TaxID=253017 RepID=UPI001FB0CEBC|nr:uncharacterized protein LOC124944888 [Impatiens glandulifera]
MDKESKRKMKKAKSHPNHIISTVSSSYDHRNRKYLDRSDDYGENSDRERVSIEVSAADEENEIDNLWERMSCIALRKRESSLKRGENHQGISPEKNGLQWKQEQKIRAARLEKQLKTRCALEDLLDEQLNHFHTIYKRATTNLIRLKDISQFLIPKEALPQEIASVWWIGDWRPSSILELIRSLPRSSPSFSSEDDTGFETEQVLSQLIHEMQIEETVLDEQMAEIQSTCVLHLPFGRVHHSNGHEFTLACIQSEYKKIHCVIIKAQHLRFKALELAVRKVLSQTDAAEFLIAFDGIQDLIHQVASDHKIKTGPVSVPFK